MALITPAAFQGAAAHSYTAARLRRALQSIAGDREGVLAAGDFAVSADSPASLRVRVAAGRALVNGDAVTRQGAYLVENDAQMTSPFAVAAHATLPRIDLLILEVIDAAPDGGSGATDAPALRVVQGTAASSPTAPAVPGSAIPLAELRINAAATTVSTITDRRPVLYGLGGASVPVVTTLPAVAQDGDEVDYLATARTDGAGNLGLDDNGGPYLWRFRYRAAEASAYKWQFVGGSPLSAWTNTATATNVTGYTGVNFPHITPPLAGVYRADYFAEAYHTQAAQLLLVSVAFGQAHEDQYAIRFAAAVANHEVAGARQRIGTVETVGNIIQMAGRVPSAASNGVFGHKRLTVTPIRVKA